MKLGNGIFYDLESTRINYIDSFETIPITTVIVGALCFIRFAIKTPLQSKLYSELLMSTLIGGTVAYSYVWW